ncbi:MAG: hypothetical protein VX736_01430, partial [Candidatus Neomarinimicrobiota bacterium]|nr:hypothetical protein [Candidatus Neomarinimicrobiota bacterium]
MNYRRHRFLIFVLLCSGYNIPAQTQVMASMKTAQMLEQRGSWDSAISIYLDILNKNPETYRAIRSLKNIYRKTQRYQDGIQFLRSRLQDRPNDIQSYVELGEFYFLNDQAGKAKDVWREGLTSFQTTQSYYRFLLPIYGQYGFNDEIKFLIN